MNGCIGLKLKKEARDQGTKLELSKQLSYMETSKKKSIWSNQKAMKDQARNT